MINVLMCVNKKYMDKAEVTLYSLTRHTNEEITVYLINKTLTENDIDKFKHFLERRCRIKLNVIEMRNSFFDDLPITEEFSIEVYFRIIAQYILPRDIDRILWLDADVVVLNDISSFYYQDMDGYCIAACADGGNGADNEIQEIKKRLGIKDTHTYFNSGVLLMNLNDLRVCYSLDETMKICGDLKDKLRFPDQDLLNYLYQDKTKYCDGKLYNYQAHSMTGFNEKETVILHYTYHKPWQYVWRRRGKVNHEKYYWITKLKIGALKDITIGLGSNVLYRIYRPFRKIVRIVRKSIS